MRIAITGAAGFIGRALALRLAEQGHDVLALDNNYRGHLGTIAPHARITRRPLDVLAAAELTDSLQGVDALFHLAAINGTGNFYEVPARVLEVGIIGTHNALKAAVDAGVSAFYFASSSEVYGNPPMIPTPESVECRITDVFNPRFSYAGSKLAGELLTVNYLRGTGIRYTIFRPHNVYGPQMGHEHVIPQIVKRLVDTLREQPDSSRVPLTLQGNGAETRAFIFIDDAVRAIELATLGNREDGVIHIGSQDEQSIAELVRMIGRVLGVAVDLQSGPIREGSPARRCPDTTRLRRLGFATEIPLELGLERTVRWYADHYAPTDDAPRAHAQPGATA